MLAFFGVLWYSIRAMLNTILKFLEVSILDTVEKITAFATLVFFGALFAGVATYFILAAIQEKQFEEYNIPFILERYPNGETF